MAKSVGMARLAYRRFWGGDETSAGWFWEWSAWTSMKHAERYLRRYAQRTRP